MMVLKIQFHLKVVKFLGKYFTMFLKKISYLRKATKITQKALHPGNCKQNVPVALAIFHESTSSALTNNFSEKGNFSQELFLRQNF